MKKYIANIITGSRIIFSLPLLFIPLSSAWFCILYLFCGFSDMIDGAIARKTGAIGKFGARLDTAADFVFMSVCAIKILPRMHMPAWLWVWMIVVALIKMLNVAAVLIRKKKLISNHSPFNKITGFALFLLPPTLIFVQTTYSVATICAFATIAVVQELRFVVKGQEDL